MFKFARNACNRVRCTRTGEHGSPPHYDLYFAIFIWCYHNKKFNHYLSDAFWYDILKSNVNFYNIHKNALKLKIILLTIANIKVYNRVDRQRVLYFKEAYL